MVAPPKNIEALKRYISRIELNIHALQAQIFANESSDGPMNDQDLAHYMRDPPAVQTTNETPTAIVLSETSASPDPQYPQMRRADRGQSSNQHGSVNGQWLVFNNGEILYYNQVKYQCEH